MTENGLFVLGGIETQLHDILWAIHDRKNHGRSEGEEAIALRAMRYCTRAIDRWLLIELDRAIPSLLLLTEAD